MKHWDYIGICKLMGQIINQLVKDFSIHSMTQRDFGGLNQVQRSTMVVYWEFNGCFFVVIFEGGWLNIYFFNAQFTNKNSGTLGIFRGWALSTICHIGMLPLQAALHYTLVIYDSNIWGGSRMGPQTQRKMDTSTACIPVLAGWNLNMFDDLEPKQRAAEFVEHLQETFR